jgi:hypothetical protein
MMWAVAEADGGMKDQEMAALKRAHQVSLALHGAAEPGQGLSWNLPAVLRGRRRV